MGLTATLHRLMSLIERDAAALAASARRWTGIYAVASFLTFVLVVSRANAGLVILLALAGMVLWVLCLVASIRALQHGKENGHEQGRAAAFLGLFLTLGCLGPLIGYLAFPLSRR